MSSSRVAIPSLLTIVAIAIAGCAENTDSAGSMALGEADYPNVITGDGFPNPNPNRADGMVRRCRRYK